MMSNSFPHSCVVIDALVGVRAGTIMGMFTAVEVVVIEVRTNVLIAVGAEILVEVSVNILPSVMDIPMPAPLEKPVLFCWTAFSRWPIVFLLNLEFRKKLHISQGKWWIELAFTIFKLTVISTIMVAIRTI